MRDRKTERKKMKQTWKRERVTSWHKEKKGFRYKMQEARTMEMRENWFVRFTSTISNREKNLYTNCKKNGSHWRNRRKRSEKLASTTSRKEKDFETRENWIVRFTSMTSNREKNLYTNCKKNVSWKMMEKQKKEKWETCLHKTSGKGKDFKTKCRKRDRTKT